MSGRLLAAESKTQADRCIGYGYGARWYEPWLWIRGKRWSCSHQVLSGRQDFDLEVDACVIFISILQQPTDQSVN